MLLVIRVSFGSSIKRRWCFNKYFRTVNDDSAVGVKLLEQGRHITAVDFFPWPLDKKL